MPITAAELPAFELEKINLFISKRYGLEFPQQRQKLLQQAILERMEVCSIATVAQYAQLLERHEAEVLLLINLLTVHETYFFREPAHFAILSKQILPRLIRTSGQYPLIRLLSAGCSTGEEAYSLAMSLLTIPGAGIDWDFEVIGVDVDKAAITKAQAGLYGLYSFRACPKDIQDNYFERLSPECFLIKRQVKEKVRFETLNLFAQAYPDWLQNMDIVFYRNVSIYFSREQQQASFRRLAGLLKPNRCLFLSCTETLYHNNKLMTLVKNGDVFYYQKTAFTASDTVTAIATHQPTATRRPAPPCAQLYPSLKPEAKRRSPVTIPLWRSSPSPTSASAHNIAACHQLFANALELTKAKNHPEALCQLDELIAVNSQFVKAYTLKATILLSQKQLAAAAKLCTTALVLEPFCLEAYLLLGISAKFDGRFEDALQHFKSAIYIAAECWLAHFYLAEMYQLQSAAVYAKREYEVTLKLLRQGHFENHGLSFFDMPFQSNDFMQLCQFNLEKL